MVALVRVGVQVVQFFSAAVAREQHDQGGESLVGTPWEQAWHDA